MTKNQAATYTLLFSGGGGVMYIFYTPVVLFLFLLAFLASAIYLGTEKWKAMDKD